jgi:hypothetical protein
MRKKMFFSLSLSALFSFLFSCSQEVIETPKPAENVATSVPTRSQSITSAFEIVDGYLKFQNERDYIAAYNSLLDKNKKELLIWSEANGYSSLLSYYKDKDAIALATFVPDHDYEPGEEFIDTSERVSDPVFATLLNSNGIVLVGDTIFKLHGKYVYKILNGDSEKAKEIDNAINSTSLDYIPHFQHTIKLQPMLKNASRSGVIMVTSTRREFVEFKYEKDHIGVMAFFRVYMVGQAQTKSLGIWWPNFDDEIVSGSVTNVIRARVSTNNNTSSSYVYVNTFFEKGYDQSEISVAPFPYGAGVGHEFSVKFEFVKHAKKGTEVVNNKYYEI